MLLYRVYTLFWRVVRQQVNLIFTSQLVTKHLPLLQWIAKFVLSEHRQWDHPAMSCRSQQESEPITIEVKKKKMVNVPVKVHITRFSQKPINKTSKKVSIMCIFCYIDGNYWASGLSNLPKPKRSTCILEGPTKPKIWVRSQNIKRRYNSAVRSEGCSSELR